MKAPCLFCAIWQYTHKPTSTRCAIENKNLKAHYDSGTLELRAARNPPDPLASFLPSGEETHGSSEPVP
eukprot:1154293-Pelagomonas_calceolata.AAC.1